MTPRQPSVPKWICGAIACACLLRAGS